MGAHGSEDAAHERINEERRLLHVAMTRAKQQLYLSFSGKPSPFLADIPEAYVVTTRLRGSPSKGSPGSSGGGGGGGGGKGGAGGFVMASQLMASGTAGGGGRRRRRSGGSGFTSARSLMGKMEGKEKGKTKVKGKGRKAKEMEGIGFATTFKPKKREAGMTVSFTTKKVGKGRKAKPKPKSTLPLPVEPVQPLVRSSTQLSAQSAPRSSTQRVQTLGISSGLQMQKKRKREKEKEKEKTVGKAPPRAPRAPPAMIRRNTSKLRKPKRKKKKPLDPNQASISSFFMPT